MNWLFLLFSLTAKAYIPSSAFIVQSVAEHHGKAPYQIEQDVRLSTSKNDVNAELTFKEIWMVESDTSQKLLVIGTGDLKDKLFISFAYVSGNRLSNTVPAQQKTLTNEFVEDFFWSTQPDRLSKKIVRLGFAPQIVGHRYVKNKDYPVEEFVKLSRLGGVVTYQIAQKTNPSLWIEQDAFAVRKIRLSDGAEVVAENYNQFARNLKFPQTRRLSWNQSEASMQLLSVAGKFSADAQAMSKKVTNTSGLNAHPLKSTFEEFYQRFR